MLMPSIFGENLFDDFMDGFAFPTANWNYAKNTANVMKTDIKENDKGYELDVDLPGYKKEDVKAELKDGYLTISNLAKLVSSRKRHRYFSSSLSLLYRFRSES